MSNRLIKYVVIILLLQPFAAYAQKITVSVMDLNTTTGLAPSEMIMLTDKLLNDLVTTEVYQVVDRSKRDEVLKELGFQQSGACDQGACLVEAGQMLGVQKMIGGTIGKLGAVYSLQLRMLDVKTGGINKAFSKAYTGDISLLLEGMREAAYYFCGTTSKAAQTAPVAKAPADTALSTLQAKAAMERKKGAGDRKKTNWMAISTCFGQNKLKTSTFYWSNKDSFSRVYEGIEWESGQHLGLEYTPATMIFSRKGNSFKINIAMSFLYENNKSSPALVTLTDEDLVTNITTTTSRYMTEKSFTLTRFAMTDPITAGYWIMFSPAYAFEPYGGICGKSDYIVLSGTEVNGKDISGMTISLGFPLGARLYLHHFFLGFEYNYFVKSWVASELSDYVSTGKLSQDGASYWNANVGVIF